MRNKKLTYEKFLKIIKLLLKDNIERQKYATRNTKTNF